jgi:hypothetical protein
MQQVLKLCAATELGADLVLLADSDVVLVRPVTIETFCKDGQVRFYRKPDEVDERLPRHLVWHDVARELLGLTPAGPPPLPDYMNPFNVWDRRIVLALRERVERVTGRPWLDAISSRLHLSECLLYGVFVDEVLGRDAHVFEAESMLCHSYSDPIPLGLGAAREFLRGLSPADVSVAISSKSHTPLDVRRRALSEVSQIASVAA